MESIIKYISDFCKKNKIPYRSIDDILEIEDFFKGVIEKYISQCKFTDQKIQDCIQSEVESAAKINYEYGYEDGKGDGYDDGYHEGFADGVNAQIENNTKKKE